MHAGHVGTKRPQEHQEPTQCLQAVVAQYPGRQKCQWQSVRHRIATDLYLSCTEPITGLSQSYQYKPCIESIWAIRCTVQPTCIGSPMLLYGLCRLLIQWTTYQATYIHPILLVPINAMLIRMHSCHMLSPAALAV